VGPAYRGHGGSDDGPISTPALEGNDLFALGPHGHLIAVDATTGTERWRHDLTRCAVVAANAEEGGGRPRGRGDVS
jgi:glucose dehydrogenase